MAHLFIDDGHIDSEEYASNYIYFDGNDPECVGRMRDLARRLAASSPENRRVLMDQAQSRQWRPCDAPSGAP
ncbi:hypothetical protein JW777_05505 [bacterium]|nr:hypothetical protein [bacterium]